jgi:hypothetical protein
MESVCQFISGNTFPLEQEWPALRAFIHKSHLIKGSQKVSWIVTPAEAGVQNIWKEMGSGAYPGLDPGFAGMTHSMEFRLFANSPQLLCKKNWK